MKARKKEERNGRLKRIKETDRKKGFEDKRKEKKWHRDRKETDKRKKRGERKGDRKKFMKKEVSQREIETAYYSRGGKSLDFNGRLKQKKQKKWNWMEQNQ